MGELMKRTTQSLAERARWAKANPVVPGLYYHGTVASALPLIKKQGLLPPEEGRDIYPSPFRSVALIWAQARRETNESRGVPAGRAVVLEVRLPDSAVREGAFADIVLAKKPIPVSCIRFPGQKQ